MVVYISGQKRPVSFRFIDCAVGKVSLLAAICFLSPTKADAEDYSVTAIVGVDTVSVNRGRRSRELNPSPFAVIEIEYGNFLGGAVATPTKIAGEVRPLLVGYAAWKPSAGPYGLTFGARYYSFPGSSDFVFDFENDGVPEKIGRKGFFEANAGIKRRWEIGELSARAFLTPNSFGETGAAFYSDISGKLFLQNDWSIRAHIGKSEYWNDRFNDDYWNHAIGIYKYQFGLDFFVRYSDANNLIGPNQRVVVFGFEKAFTLLSSDARRDSQFDKIRNDLTIDKAFLRGIP